MTQLAGARAAAAAKAWGVKAHAYSTVTDTPLQALNDAKGLLTKLDLEVAALRRDIVQRTGERTTLAVAQSKATADVQTARRSVRSPSETLQQNE